MGVSPLRSHPQRNSGIVVDNECFTSTYIDTYEE